MRQPVGGSIYVSTVLLIQPPINYHSTEVYPVCSVEKSDFEGEVVRLELAVVLQIENESPRVVAVVLVSTGSAL